MQELCTIYSCTHVAYQGGCLTKAVKNKSSTNDALTSHVAADSRLNVDGSRHTQPYVPAALALTCTANSTSEIKPRQLDYTSLCHGNVQAALAAHYACRVWAAANSRSCRCSCRRCRQALQSFTWRSSRDARCRLAKAPVTPCSVACCCAAQLHRMTAPGTLCKQGQCSRPQRSTQRQGSDA